MMMVKNALQKRILQEIVGLLLPALHAHKKLPTEHSHIYVYKEKSNYRKRKYASKTVLVRKRRGQFASLYGISQRRTSRGQTFISMRLFPFSPVAVAKNRHRGSEGRICTLSRICTLPSSPKLLRTLFAVLAGPEWRVNGGYLEAERHVHNERRTEMEKSEGKGSSQFPDPRIRSAPRNRSSLQNLRNCYATREAVIMRHQRKLWQSDRRSTHDSLDTSSRSWTLGTYFGQICWRCNSEKRRLKDRNTNLQPFCMYRYMLIERINGCSSLINLYMQIMKVMR